MLTTIEKQDRVRALYQRLHGVLAGFDFSEAEKFKPSFTSDFWEEYDRLDVYCARYMAGGMDWESDVLATANHLFNLIHEYTALAAQIPLFS